MTNWKQHILIGGYRYDELSSLLYRTSYTILMKDRQNSSPYADRGIIAFKRIDGVNFDIILDLSRVEIVELRWLGIEEETGDAGYPIIFHRDFPLARPLSKEEHSYITANLISMVERYCNYLCEPELQRKKTYGYDD